MSAPLPENVFWPLGSAIAHSPDPGAPEVRPECHFAFQRGPPVGGASGIARRVQSDVGKVPSPVTGEREGLTRKRLGTGEQGASGAPRALFPLPPLKWRDRFKFLGASTLIQVPKVSPAVFATMLGCQCDEVPEANQMLSATRLLEPVSNSYQRGVAVPTETVWTFQIRLPSADRRCRIVSRSQGIAPG